MSKRICVVRQNYFPEEAHVKKNVDALIDAGYQVDVVCLRQPGESARDDYRGGTISRVPLTHKRASKFRYLFEYVAFFVLTALLLAYRSVRERYDVVEIYNLPDLLVFGAAPAKLAGSKLVFYMFEMMPEQMGENYGLEGSSRVVRFLHWAEGISVRFADRVITVSPYQRLQVSQRSRPTVRPAVVMNVPDDSTFRPNCNRHDHATFRAITHGSILRRYGIQTLIRAVPHLLNRIPNLEVMILGDGEYKEDLLALADTLDVADKVRFVEAIPHDEVPAMLAEADIGVVPMSIPWILPNKLFEYVAMKRPVVSSASPSLTGLFDQDAVSYFMPDNERDLARRILELHDDPDRAASQAERASQAFESLRWERMSKTYVDVYDELTGPASVRTPTAGETA